ncbi:DJ-1/PfpI family protein [Achromobacter xylosoxidans]|uniref:DJ-1/PfpI family protein n=1 Tax=Alcaligenes xylosoxydans xylosoxydans TaxID=85698 RepID=UPI003BF51CE3
MKEIALIAFDQFTDIDLFLMWDILGRNTRDWNTRILASRPVIRSAHGLSISVHGALSEANHADAVLFASGRQGIPAALADPDFLPAFRLDPARQHIGSICAGAFILERLGLLSGGRATTHPGRTRRLANAGVGTRGPTPGMPGKHRNGWRLSCRALSGGLDGGIAVRRRKTARNAAARATRGAAGAL